MSRSGLSVALVFAGLIAVTMACAALPSLDTGPDDAWDLDDLWLFWDQPIAGPASCIGDDEAGVGG